MLSQHGSNRKPLLRLESLEDRSCPSGGHGGEGVITNPALVYVNTNPSDLFLITANGSATKQITNDGRANIAKESPAWSPDGTRIAFLRAQSSGGPVASGGLYTINADGTALTQVYDFVSTGPGIQADTGHIDWSPDGTKIAFAGWGGAGLKLFILDVASGAVLAPTPPFSNVDKVY